MKICLKFTQINDNFQTNKALIFFSQKSTQLSQSELPFVQKLHIMWYVLHFLWHIPHFHFSLCVHMKERGSEKYIEYDCALSLLNAISSVTMGNRPCELAYLLPGLALDACDQTQYFISSITDNRVESRMLCCKC